MTALTQAMERANDRDSEWQGKWNKAKTDYFLASANCSGRE